MTHDRYARQMILPQVGAAGQARLAAAHVVVVGAGGLGSTVIPALAGAGVGRLTILDADHVEASNLHRQPLYTMADIGQPKAQIAAARAQAMNPECKVTALVQRAGPDDTALVASADLVVDAGDNFATSYTLSDLCLAAQKPLISASVLGMAGFVAGFCGGAPSYRAVFPQPDSAAGTCATAGVLGPAVAVLGAMQAQMALAVLLEMTPSPLGRMVTLDLQRWHFGGFGFCGAEESKGFSFVAQPLPTDMLIDLRVTQPDLAALTLPRGRIVLACKTGLRAWRAAEILAARGARDIALMADGQ